eukprot:244498_1
MEPNYCTMCSDYDPKTKQVYGLYEEGIGMYYAGSDCHIPCPGCQPGYGDDSDVDIEAREPQIDDREAPLIPNYDDQIMDMSGKQQHITIPRLNGEMLESEQFKGMEISIVGKFLESNKNDSSKHATFEASDGRKFNVQVDTSQTWSGYNTKFIEIRGILQNDAVVLQKTHQEWGNDFDMATWGKFIRLTHQYPNLF